MKRYPLTYNEFKKELTEGKFLGLRCLECGIIITPPISVCTSCGSSNLEITPISNKGKIKTFTVIRVGPRGFDTPYIVAMVELEDGPWVVGNVLGVNPDEADMALIEKEVSIGYKLLPHNDAEGGVEGIVLTFTPRN